MSFYGIALAHSKHRNTQCRKQGSELTYQCTQSPAKFVFINHNAMGSRIGIFQIPFSMYATVINETPELVTKAKNASYIS